MTLRLPWDIDKRKVTGPEKQGRILSGQNIGQVAVVFLPLLQYRSYSYSKWWDFLATVVHCFFTPLIYGKKAQGYLFTQAKTHRHSSPFTPGFLFFSQGPFFICSYVNIQAYLHKISKKSEKVEKSNEMVQSSQILVHYCPNWSQKHSQIWWPLPFLSFVHM